jgi:hypothetical protein
MSATLSRIFASSTCNQNEQLNQSNMAKEKALQKDKPVQKKTSNGVMVASDRYQKH